MARIQPAVFAKALSGEGYKPEAVYLLYGMEPRQVGDAAARLKAKLMEGAGADNYYRYTRLGAGQDEVSVREVVAQLNTVSMFGGGKLVMLGPLESVGKEDAEELAGYAEDPNPQSSLVVTVTIPKGDNRAMTAFEKSRMAQAFEKGGAVVKLSPPRGEEIYKWVEARFRSKGLAIGRPAAERLVELVDRDLDRLGAEVEKLSSYVGDRAEVTMEDVDVAVGEHHVNEIWDLLKAVRNRDAAAATAAMENLLEQNQWPQLILKMLTVEIMRVASARWYKDTGAPFEVFASSLGGPVYPLREAWGGAARWPQEDILEALRATLDANMNIMRKGAAPETALACLIFTICGRPSAQAGRGR